MSRTIRLVAVFIPLALLTGCGGKGDVSGTVNYQGKPVAKGQVTFQGQDGKTYMGDIQDGKYKVSGVPTGTAKIAVTALDESITEHFRKMSEYGRGNKGEGPPKAPPPAIDPASMYLVPQKYADVNSSGLSYEVKSGSNTHNIDIN
jgi:hypothetical protein